MTQNLIPTPTMSEFVYDDFMEPLNLTVDEVAHAVNVPSDVIQNIITDNAKMTPELSIMLGRYFGMNDDYFMGIQTDIDMRNAQLAYGGEYAKIGLTKAMPSYALA